MAGDCLRVYIYMVLQPALVMIKTKNVVAALRRDVSFIGNAVVVVIFICFAGLAVAAALLDLLAFRN